jgi:hypothetical protein
MSNPDQDPWETWLDEAIARYRASLHDAQIVGDDETGYIVQVEGATPTEMAGDFCEVLDAEKLAVLLAYTVRRCALQEVDLEG